MKLKRETIYEKVQIDAKAMKNAKAMKKLRLLSILSLMMQCSMLENTQLGLLYAKLFS